MRYGFTGTRTLDAADELVVARAVSLLEDGTEFTTGACIGADFFVGQSLWLAKPDAVHRVIVPADRSRVDHWWTHRAIGDTVRVEEMSAGTTYKDRNLRIVEHSDVLVAFPAHPEDDPRSRRSGTWQTVRMARQRGIVVIVTVLDRPDEVA